MLLEVPLAMVAWVGVVLIQAIFHFGMLGNNNARRDQNLSPDGAEVDDSCFQLDEDEDDEDPPEGLETLLSQTGDEVISIIRSNSFIEHRAMLELGREREHED